MDTAFKSMCDDQGGATAIEYALIASLVSIFIIGALMMVNGSMIEMFNFIAENINPALQQN
ncbi:Flp family type IVb pilin [Pelagibacterium montanilacus]|uniref:Flp family type IVb pilin n=1 Tax=Pelagibacterium montanilacus TaxID=2185280 RepID=UPI000F8CAAC7|nr:Flp family type IVb pilin [Pelagibacterium montanilacus]